MIDRKKLAEMSVAGDAAIARLTRTDRFRAWLERHPFCAAIFTTVMFVVVTILSIFFILTEGSWWAMKDAYAAYREYAKGFMAEVKSFWHLLKAAWLSVFKRDEVRS